MAGVPITCFLVKTCYDSTCTHVGYLKKTIVLDEVVVALFKGPKSYTGEDVVEFSCRGPPFVQQQVIELPVYAGARDWLKLEVYSDAF